MCVQVNFNYPRQVNILNICCQITKEIIVPVFMKHPDQLTNGLLTMFPVRPIFIFIQAPGQDEVVKNLHLSPQGPPLDNM